LLLDRLGLSIQHIAGERVWAKKRRIQNKKILECALDLFNEKGVEQVPVEQITQRAGVEQGSFYTYFRTKSDVIVKEFLQIDVFYDELSSTCLQELSDAIAKLRTFIRAQLEYVQAEVRWRKLKAL